MRVVVGGVGYRSLRDHSLGVQLSDDLAAVARPPALVIEDLSYNPVAVAQWLADEARAAPISRAVFVSAIARDDGRAAGTITAYRWDQALPADDIVQRAVADAVTGVIHLDNTLIVTEWMNALPSEVLVVEVEPWAHAFGDELSAPLAAAYIDARRLVMELATDDLRARTVPVMSLGGRRSPPARATWSSTE
jgi:hypothetical protein